MAEDKSRQPNWTEPERVCAVKSINMHFDDLFCKFKGATMGAKRKEAVWQTVTDELNSSGVASCKRSVDQVKVMYKNVKARGKFKEGEKKKTGGGPPPQLTAAEEEVMLQIRCRPQVIGISGFDSESIPIPSTSCQEISSVNIETDMESLHEDDESMKNTTGSVMQKTQKTSSGLSGKKRRRVDGDELFSLEVDRAALEIKLLQQRLNQEREMHLINIEKIKEKSEQEKILFNLRKDLLSSKLTDAFENGYLNLES